VTHSGKQTPDWGSDYNSNGWSTKKMALAGLALGGLAAATYLMRRRMRKQTPYERFMDAASEYLGFASDFASDHFGTASGYFDAASGFARDRHPAWWAGLAAAALPLAYYAWPSSKPTYQEQARDHADDFSSMLEGYLRTLMTRMPSGSESRQMASDAYHRMPSFSDLEMPSDWRMPSAWKRPSDWSMPSEWPVDPKLAVPAGVVAASALTFFLSRRMVGGRKSMRIGDVMTRQPRVIQPDATVADAAAMMRQLDVGSLPVCDGSRLVGMVTDRDITTRSTADGRDPHLTPVRDVMSPGVAWATENDPVEEAARIMREQRIRRLPIVNERHSLVGVVSLGDLATDLHDDEVSGNTLERVSEPNHHR
jgi:CBS domain-containing protein